MPNMAYLLRSSATFAASFIAGKIIFISMMFLSVLMNIIEMKMIFPAMNDAAKVALLLSKYAMFGIVPVIVPPLVDTPRSPTNGYDQQTGTDLDYIKGLAHNCGYTFYLEPGPAPLMNLAYFGPDVRIPVPQPSLNVNS